MEAHIEAWLKDLRTTSEPQCRQWLHTDDGYCCLGRLVEVELGHDVWKSSADEGYGYSPDSNSTNIDHSLATKYKLNKIITVTKLHPWDTSIHVEKITLQEYAINLNDAGVSFKLISAIIGSILADIEDNE